MIFTKKIIFVNIIHLDKISINLYLKNSTSIITQKPFYFFFLKYIIIIDNNKICHNVIEKKEI